MSDDRLVPTSLKRRDLLSGAAGTLTAASLSRGLLSPAAALAGGRPLDTLGEARAFDYAWLKGHARMLAQQPYQSHSKPLPPSVADLTWDRHQAIRFRKARALWGDQALRFQGAFFHLGMYQKAPVRIFELADGRARELAYDPAMFDYGKSGLAPGRLPRDLGFAGFRLQFHTDWDRDVVAFLGASYFRAVGAELQYGLSARGLAVNCGMDKPEEFPAFTTFWLERPQAASSTATVYALMDSPSVSGAYRFEITPGGVLSMDVDAALYPRVAIERLGIAPCTSMFQCGENDRRMGYDFRPEIHDSDGLAMWTGGGEWIWRPLLNPAQLRFNAHADNNPRGFGLLQRDRDFDHYQDDGVFYDRRPSLWVEPKSHWGPGSVTLVEIPTVDETFDNIAAFWTPREPPQPGQELLYSYRLHWGGRVPAAPPLAQAVATRFGLGGVVGQKRRYYSGRFAVDFSGGELPLLEKNAPVEPVVTASRGAVELTSARPLHALNRYRALFDVRVDDDSPTPINLRLYLRLRGQPLTETWLYQWTPPPPADRRLY
ncbi:MAG TPA: glucan biosynthesis protein D [Myxococcaceae bacterium]|nr:glucan biosynthesis protein D [Myxococcaceae bacterium]